MVQKKLDRQKVVELTEYLKTKSLTTMEEEEKQVIIQRIRETLPKRRGIVEAIKPYIKDFDDLSEQEKSIVILNHFDGTELINKMDLTLKELQHIEDEDYYVDIEDELKKDLYARQRVVDQYVVQYDEERKDLLGYHENLYHKATPNRFVHIVYANQFDLTRVRAALAVGLFNTAAATVVLSMVHPLLPLIMVYDYYKCARYMQLLNNTLIRMSISKSKRKIFLETLNFLGYWKKPKLVSYNITKCKYIRSFKNTSLNPNEIGWLPSIMAIKRLIEKYILKKVRT